jgi:hypothetical protein
LDSTRRKKKIRENLPPPILDDVAAIVYAETLLWNEKELKLLLEGRKRNG